MQDKFLFILQAKVLFPLRLRPYLEFSIDLLFFHESFLYANQISISLSL